TARVQLPEKTRMVIDVVGGRPPYATSANFDGSDHAGVVHDITLGPTPKTITITASDASTPQKSRTLTITAKLREPQAIEAPPGAAPPQAAILETTSITLDGEPQSGPRLRLVLDGGDHVVVGVERPVPEPNTAWEVEGAPAGPSATV